MVDAARKAGRALARDFGEVAELQVSKKGAADYVSAADLKAEQTLFEELTRARPGYGFLGEERGMIEGTDKTHTGSSTPSTAPRTSCTPCRTSRSTSPCNARAKSSPA